MYNLFKIWKHPSYMTHSLEMNSIFTNKYTILTPSGKNFIHLLIRGFEIELCPSYNRMFFFIDDISSHFIISDNPNYKLAQDNRIIPLSSISRISKCNKIVNLFYKHDNKSKIISYKVDTKYSATILLKLLKKVIKQYHLQTIKSI